MQKEQYWQENRRWIGASVRIGACMLVVALAGCDGLLDVQDPDIIAPGDLSDPTGRDALYAGAIGDFAVAYAGGDAGKYVSAMVTASALMSDEAYWSGESLFRVDFDRRQVDPENPRLLGMFHRVQRARAALENAADELGQAAETVGEPDPRIGELYALAGFSYVSMAELYCSGVPISHAPASGDLQFGEPLTTAELLELGLTRFDTALANAAESARISNLALVGTARAHMNLGHFADAANLVEAVPTDFVYKLAASIDASKNGFFTANGQENRISIADSEGGNGLPFRSADDPRVQLVQDPAGGFGGQRAQFDLIAYAITGETLAPGSGTPLASGIEARLIEAEAALNSDDPGTAFALLNALRARIGLDPLVDPGTEQARVDLLFRERAFWLFATGHRLGDLRRLVRQYGRDAGNVFPSGDYFDSATAYGTDVNYPVPVAEQNNAKFQGCLDRRA